MKSLIRVLSLASIFALTGCLGGGSSSSNSSNPSPTPTPSPNAPSVAITAPAANTTTSSTISLSGTCTASVSTVDISGATPTSTSCAANGTYSVSITLSAPTGSKTVTVSQTNSDGTGSNSRVFVLNPSVPSVSITSPTANTVTASTISLQGSCDSSVSNVDISGATPTSTTCSGGSFSQSVNLSGADGSKTVTISQTNSDGTGSDNRSFVLDTTAPTSTSISINSGASYTNSTSATLTLAATDANSGIQMYVTNTSGCGSGGSYETFNASKSWTLGQTNGTATVYVKFKDAVGNESSCISDTITHDSVAPSIAYSSPADGSYGTTGLTVAGTCEDGLTVTVNGSGITATTATCSSGTFSKAVTFTAGEGNKQVTISQTDLASNSTSVTRTFVRDNTSPGDVTFTAPASDGSTSSSNYNFQWNTATDNYTVASYKIDIFQNNNCSGSPTSIVNSQVGTSYNLTLNTGDNTIKVYARDGAGNLSTGICSSKITYNVPGSLDTTFGTSGVVTETVAQTTTNLALLVDASDKIFVGADSGIFKYLTTGSRDTSFATTGFKSLTSYYASYSINDINVDGSGNVYAIGSNPSGTDSYSDVAVIGLTSSGGTNSGFNSSTGKNQMDTFPAQNSSETGYKGVFISGVGLMIATNTQIVAGQAYLGYSNFKADGTFGTLTGGYSTTSPFSGNAYGTAIAYRSDVGTFLVVGQNNNNFALAFGDISNSTFGSGTYKYTTDFSGGTDIASDALFYDTSNGGRWVVCGSSYNSGTGIYSLAIARYASTSATLDINFGGGTGKVLEAVSTRSFNPSCIKDSSGNIYATGLVNDDVFVIKLLPSGTVDTSFGTNGVQEFIFGVKAWNSKLVIDSSGKLILAAYLNQSGTKQVKVMRIFK